MTSYNKINGVWGHYQYELVTDILRGEWGYDGVVMTDWWAKCNLEQGDDGNGGYTLIPMETTLKDQMEADAKAAEEKAKAEAEEKARLEKEANPSTEELLKKILAVIESK